MPRFELRLPWRCYSSSQGLGFFCIFLLWCAPLKINGTMQRTWGMEVAEVALDILRCAGRVLPSVKKQKRHFALPNGNLPQQVIA